MSDEPRDPEGEPTEPPEGEDKPGAGETPEAPPPATWAGRRASADEPEGDEAELAGEHRTPPLPGDETADEDPEAPGELGLEEGDAEETGDVEPEDDEPEAEEAEDAEPAPGEPEPDRDGQDPGATIEADTLAIADQEQAREAALQGLRARTASHAAKRGVTDPGLRPESPAEAKDPAPDEAEPAEEKEQPSEPATVVAATAAGEGEEDAKPEKPPRAGLWARFMAASFLIIASMAAATSISILVYLTDIAKGLGGLPNIEDQLDEITTNAQNFLIIGSDVRPNQEGEGLSDTAMLLRVDPDRGVITQLSIPRDLRVNIPNHGVDKFNAAYSYGGPELTLRTIKQFTGGGIPIHHVVNIDFNGFADAVDAIGCVYIDVDRHYFNDNSTAATLADQYAEIDIQAGYQRLCGYKALQYVRFRHEDNDIVRAARQQGFLREARQKVPPGKLYDDREELIEIFKDYTTSDIDDSGTLVTLFKLMFDARGAQINQIEFPFDSLDEQGYVTASDKPLQGAIAQFLGEEPEPSGGGGGEDGGGGGGQGSKPKPKPKPKPDAEAEGPPAPELLDATVAGSQYAALIRDQGGQDINFPILYPTMLPPQSELSDDTRFFGIDADGDLRHGYKFVVRYPGTTYPTAYYGISATNWVGAPLFANPSERRTIGEREYLLFYDGGRLRMLAFRKGRGMYWVTNTLDNLLDEPEMIAIAQNLREAGT